jgi:hypothetical protein
MSGWIKFDKDMVNDPRLIDAAELIAADYLIARSSPSGRGGQDLEDILLQRFLSNALRGALIALWCYADEYIRDDNSLPCNTRAIDAMVGIDGFCSLLPTDWIEYDEQGENVRLPRYREKNEIASRDKRKADAAERQRRWRERHNASRNGTVTRESRVSNAPYTETKTEEEKTSLRSVQKKATRLQSNAVMTDEYREVAVEEGIENPERVFAMFVDHFSAAPGEKGRKLNWVATWRNWCRRETDWKRRQTGTARAWTTRATQESALAAIEAAQRESTTERSDDDGYIRIE